MAGLHSRRLCRARPKRTITTTPTTFFRRKILCFAFTRELRVYNPNRNFQGKLSPLQAKASFQEVRAKAYFPLSFTNLPSLTLTLPPNLEANPFSGPSIKGVSKQSRSEPEPDLGQLFNLFSTSHGLISRNCQPSRLISRNCQPS